MFCSLLRISTEKCYEVTTAFQQSGLPVSIFIFKEMGEANGISGGHLHITKAASKSEPVKLLEKLITLGTVNNLLVSVIFVRDINAFCYVQFHTHLSRGAVAQSVEHRLLVRRFRV